MLELKNLSLELENDNKKVNILQNINLKFEKNKIYAITGPNGGGKSSLAKTIMGIYKTTSGNILLDGEDITNLNITERARQGVGFAFQQPARFKGIKVNELLNLAAKDNEVNICKLLLDVGLCAQDYVNRDVDSSLSGGELKRIEIATILARNLKVALFDEPEAGIDLWSFKKLVETFENMNRKQETTIIIISHQERILNLADEVIILSDGTIKEITSKENILAQIIKNDSCNCGETCEKGRTF
ncbi:MULTISPECIES: ABC transporter ATP-binding protein [Clostridium]|uniref:ABC transporter related protein n=2 Tax=Clostridium TaxID=1485 RepID=A0A0E3M6F2_CLOSL|nr:MULTISPECIES: ATP-binding cassette domain-containing protein [Clostridium]AKA67578.1 ABC transporter related protein [Clostridium scatologenes]AWI05997.1 ABC transporter ATP-binding protein [Clostridium drakei]